MMASLDPAVRMEGVAYSQVALIGPARVRPPPADEWRLYVVRAGTVVLDAGAGAMTLACGTAVAVSGTIPHVFATGGADGSAACIWTEEALGRVAQAGATIIVVGRVPRSLLPFLSMVGMFVVIDPACAPGPAGRIGALIDMIADETRRGDRASAAIIPRLAEITTLEVERFSRARAAPPGEQPADTADDARLWRAIAAVFADPRGHWTVGAMARAAGMSRTVFAERYRRMIGTPPLRSLRRLRLHRAAAALAQISAPPLALVAAEAGYGSEAAFSRAFAREFASPPGEYRRRARRL